MVLTMKPRTRTIFHICRNHGRLHAHSRQRRAEFFSEGGPAFGPPCTPGDPCRMWAGTDLFVPEVCDGLYPLHWGVNTKEAVNAG